MPCTLLTQFCTRTRALSLSLALSLSFSLSLSLSLSRVVFWFACLLQNGWLLGATGVF